MLLPIYILLGLWIKILMGSPVVFRQERPGKNGQVFELFKFRSMTDQRNDQNELLPDSERITKFGAWIRLTSLDELPSLYNVVRGDMSLVGPRPLLVEYLPLYSKEQTRRHEVRPGVTGWAQVNGRNAISWEEKFELDVWYVENQTFFVDLKILLLTMIKVFKRDGINSSHYATMDAFTGESKQLDCRNASGD